jgi:hypothetical protein
LEAQLILSLVKAPVIRKKAALLQLVQVRIRGVKAD